MNEYSHGANVIGSLVLFGASGSSSRSVWSESAEKRKINDVAFQVSSFDGRYYYFRKSVFDRFRFRYDTQTGYVEEASQAGDPGPVAWVPTGTIIKRFRYVPIGGAGRNT